VTRCYDKWNTLLINLQPVASFDESSMGTASSFEWLLDREKTSSMSRAYQLQYDLEHINFSNISQIKIDDETIYNFIKSLYYERSLKELSDSFVGSSVQMPPPDVVIALPPGVVRPSPPVVVPIVIPLVDW
jgi:hypothetical protein